MNTQAPITVSEPEWDRGLWWMVLASGGLHLVAVGLLLLMPQSFLPHPPPMMSYTVDLVAPDKAGGTNMIRGGKGRVDAPPMAAPEPKVEVPKPPPAKPPEPPKVELPKPVEVPKPVPPPEPPKIEDKPKEDEVALAEKTKPSQPPPTPTAEPPAEAKPPPSAPPTIDAQAAKAAADAKAAAEKAAKEAARAKAAKAASEAKAAKEAAEAKAAKVAADAKAAKEAAEAKAAKAAADAKAAKEAAEAKARDTRIAAAVRRVEQQSGARGGGTGNKPGEQTGGAISVGSGEGAGGIVGMGVEYLLYYNMLQSRIKQSWAWAGTNQGLEAVVRFNISESGEVMNVRITHSSGDASFDASVDRAVRSLNPLPPPPEKYRQQFSDVEVPFSLAQLQQ